jgi:crotonobetainyl-CoA:carnitine CoA-transferase CaiB-like acyl-CoA transferase
MVDGVASLTAMVHGFLAQDRWVDEVGVNFSDGGSPHYEVHETADGRFVAVAAAEPRFYAEFLERLGLDPQEVPDRDDPAQRAALRELIAGVLRTRTREEWEKEFDGTDACVTPACSGRPARSPVRRRAREKDQGRPCSTGVWRQPRSTGCERTGSSAPNRPDPARPARRQLVARQPRRAGLRFGCPEGSPA